MGDSSEAVLRALLLYSWVCVFSISGGPIEPDIGSQTATLRTEIQSRMLSFVTDVRLIVDPVALVACERS